MTTTNALIAECRRSADEHMPMGFNVLGQGPDPYEPHAHPFAMSGLVACCTGNADCRIEGHITNGDDGYRHVQRGSVVGDTNQEQQ